MTEKNSVEEMKCDELCFINTSKKDRDDIKKKWQTNNAVLVLRGRKMDYETNTPRYQSQSYGTSTYGSAGYSTSTRILYEKTQKGCGRNCTVCIGCKR